MTESTKFKPLDDNAQEISLGMSNDDGSIDDGLSEILQSEPCRVYGSHCAWDHCGRVWWDGEQFCEQVWCYGSVVGALCAPTLRELMNDVNEQYGCD